MRNGRRQGAGGRKKVLQCFRVAVFRTRQDMRKNGRKEAQLRAKEGMRD